METRLGCLASVFVRRFKRFKLLASSLNYTTHLGPRNQYGPQLLIAGPGFWLGRRLEANSSSIACAALGCSTARTTSKLFTQHIELPNACMQISAEKFLRP